MSEVRANTLSNAAGTGPAALTGQSPAKVWFHYDQTVPQLDDSFNVASFTDLASGQFEISLTNAMASGTYSVSGSGIGSNISAAETYNFGSLSVAKAVSSFRVSSYSANQNNFRDLNEGQGVVHGDLA